MFFQLLSFSPSIRELPDEAIVGLILSLNEEAFELGIGAAFSLEREDHGISGVNLAFTDLQLEGVVSGTLGSVSVTRGHVRASRRDVTGLIGVQRVTILE